MDTFIKSEIKNLKKLRRFVTIALCCLNFAILLFFIYNFYETYSAKNLNENFLSYSGKTLIQLEMWILLPLCFIFLILNRRINFVIAQLRDLNGFFSELYQEYCECKPRFFSEIPKYIISQKGLIINNNWRQRTLLENDYDRINIRRINLGRFGRKCIVQIFQNNNKVTSIKYERLYPEEVDFLIENIRSIKSDISIS